jgi:penicillin-binding protein 2
LRGTEGTVQKIVTSTGKTICDEKISTEQEGSFLKTTLDIRLQKICESVFPETYAGTIIIMDPRTGDILAMVSRPSYDPSLFLSPLSYDTWSELQNKNCPFLNRACDAAYPPGSIFKLVSVSAALEQGVIQPHETITCHGFTQFGGRLYRCNRQSGHGTVTLRKAVAHSCNILFYELAKNRKLTVDLLAEYASKFGLGTKTGIVLPEKEGLVPTRAWKYNTKQEPWWHGETLAVSIGQSYLLATPLQIARMIAGIFTGFLICPRLLLTEQITKIPLDIQPKTRDILQRLMKFVVKKGTGKDAQAVRDITIYAKTSTAQTASLDKRDISTYHREHGWFVSYMQYHSEEPLILTVLIEHGGSSKLATSTARRFVIEYKRMVDSTAR